MGSELERFWYMFLCSEAWRDDEYPLCYLNTPFGSPGEEALLLGDVPSTAPMGLVQHKPSEFGSSTNSVRSFPPVRIGRGTKFTSPFNSDISNARLKPAFDAVGHGHGVREAYDLCDDVSWKEMIESDSWEKFVLGSDGRDAEMTHPEMVFETAFCEGDYLFPKPDASEKAGYKSNGKHPKLAFCKSEDFDSDSSPFDPTKFGMKEVKVSKGMTMCLRALLRHLFAGSGWIVDSSIKKIPAIELVNMLVGPILREKINLNLLLEEMGNRPMGWKEAFYIDVLARIMEGYLGKAVSKKKVEQFVSRTSSKGPYRCSPKFVELLGPRPWPPCLPEEATLRAYGCYIESRRTLKRKDRK